MEPHRRLDLSFIPCKPSIVDEFNMNESNCTIANNSTESYNDKLDEIKEYIGKGPNLNILVNRQGL